MLPARHSALTSTLVTGSKSSRVALALGAGHSSVGQDWGHVPALPFNTLIAFGKLLNLAMLQGLHL